MKITIAVWSSHDELSQNFVEATTRHSGLTFATTAQGGFSDASFSVQASGWHAIRWYRNYLGYHVVFFDQYGRRIYEGKISEAEASDQGADVTCIGYYSLASDLLQGIVYPASDVLTATKLLEDTVNIAHEKTDLWNGDTSMLQKLTWDLSPQDFSGSKKLLDAIDLACKYGNDATVPKPMYFSIWENRRAYFKEAPDLYGYPEWRLYTRNFDGSISVSRSISDIWNKIQVEYDDPLIGTTYTDFAEDKNSQAQFGLREGTMNIGSAEQGMAEVIRDLAIASYAWPEQTSKVSIIGRVYTKAGAPEEPYMVRAGSTVQVMDYDATVSQLVGGNATDAAMAYISRTSYSADKNTLSLELGKKNVQLDLLMARLGMSSGSVS